MRLAILAMTGLIGGLPSLAVAAPPELLNKSVTVSYTVTIPAKGQDGRVIPGVRNTRRTIYISSAGRAFTRVDRQDGRLSDTREAAPGEARNTIRFQGDKLVGVVQFVSGAGQMVVTFGQAGQSCNASIIMGRESGRTLRWKGVNGITYEATGAPTISNVSCSISAGNAFAGQ